MRIWPVILDSQPSYLHGRGRSSSLLLAPLGRTVLVEHLAAELAQVTDNPPLIVASEDAVDERYAEWIHALCPKAKVATTGEEFADALAGHELSDAVLFIDPRCLPVRGLQLAQLLKHHIAEPRVSHHLVAFEPAVAGTRERLSFDATGQVRGIQRLYDQTTWALISGVSVAIVPSSCGLASDGTVPRSLASLRQMLIDHGVPSRDVPIEGGALDLKEERGMLAANEQLILEAASLRPADGAAAPLRVGKGHTIHATARMMGPVIVHPDAWIDANATVLGPAVVGRGARIGSGAVVAHATIGPDCVVPPNAVIRDRAWFKSSGEHAFGGTERPPVSFTDRLARLSLDAGDKASEKGQQSQGATSKSLKLKRALDVTVAAAGLLLASPLVILIAMAVWLESRGPIFYGDKREGMGGRGFKCWKFRTMFTGAHLTQQTLKALDQTDGPHFKLDRDPRVTKVGRVLRALNIDEIPQLYNVLNGEMSLVGPRPSPFRENQVCVPWRVARLSVRPGITGFWQVCRHNRSEGDFHQWIEYDLLYVQHLSFWLDLKILAATVLTAGGKFGSMSPSRLVEETTTAEDVIPQSIADPKDQPNHETERVA
jgi:lipopolysaccharide/colanic/teichoic acid biosynthesis glycosyltransferase